MKTIETYNAEVKEAYAIYATLNTGYSKHNFVTLWVAASSVRLDAEAQPTKDAMPSLWDKFLLPGGAVGAAG